jgi:hypothetical protein
VRHIIYFGELSLLCCLTVSLFHRIKFCLTVSLLQSQCLTILLFNCSTVSRSHCLTSHYASLQVSLSYCFIPPLYRGLTSLMSLTPTSSLLKNSSS